jgi:hydroxyacylglutathione hydrolase
MIVVKRFYDPKLAQASYLIGATDSRTAVVIDANRDSEQYVAAAADEGLTITHVTETHIHADFVSGSRELAARTGARLYLSDEGGDEWRYAFAAVDRAVLLKDGDAFTVGSVRLEALHTPGHTPEHLMFLVTDTSVTNEPLAAITGDFLFVADVGRPDLLERAAHVAGTMDGAARALYRSLRRLQPLADHLQIWPGHGAGSACGKGLGSLPQSTLGYERRTNWALGAMREDDFVHRVLEGQPDPPAYFGEMKRVNKAGPRVLGEVALPGALTVDQLSGLASSGALLVDIRPAAEYAAANVPGTLNIPLNKSFTTWAGSLIPYTTDFFLITGDRRSQSLEEALRDLSLIGLDRVAGYAGVEALAEWRSRGYALGSIPQVDVATAAEKLRTRSADALDVRARSEWESGHIPGATHIFLGDLAERSATLSKPRPLIVHCQGGTRSAIAASLLQARGFTQVMNMPAGFSEWEAAGQPVERERAEATAGHR